MGLLVVVHHVLVHIAAAVDLNRGEGRRRRGKHLGEGREKERGGGEGDRVSLRKFLFLNTCSEAYCTQSSTAYVCM